MARVPYRTADDLPPEYRYLMTPSNPFTGDEQSDDEDGPWEESPHTHRAISNNPDMLEAFRRFGGSIWTETGLTTRQRELAILTIAKSLESEYEWYQHVTIALDQGVSREAIEALATGDFGPLADEEIALIEYLSAFVDRSVDDDTHARLTDHFSDDTVVGIGLLAAYYIGIDYMGDALDLDLEGEFVGWELENV
jgi:alkylhydroperoxidase family enzyme